MRITLDANVLAYVEGVNDDLRRERAADFIVRHARSEIVIPMQALLELRNVLARKTRLPPPVIETKVLLWVDRYETVATDLGVLVGAMELVSTHRIGWWDAVVVASAAEARCSLLVSEDMQEGFTWRGVTVRNPFAG